MIPDAFLRRQRRKIPKALRPHKVAGQNCVPGQSARFRADDLLLGYDLRNRNDWLDGSQVGAAGM